MKYLNETKGIITFRNMSDDAFFSVLENIENILQITMDLSGSLW